MQENCGMHQTSLISLGGVHEAASGDMKASVCKAC